MRPYANYLTLKRQIGWLFIRWVVVSFLHAGSLQPMAGSTGMLPWIERVSIALSTTNARYPFLAYGTDWLAFAHLVIAAAFIGPYIDPVRNKRVVTFGLVACAGVMPLALIAGSVRGIPLPWRLLDCSFGILGSVPLLIYRKNKNPFQKRRVHWHLGLSR